MDLCPGPNPPYDGDVKNTKLQPRVDFNSSATDAYRAMIALETAVRKTGLERSLLELVKLRASQINGCGYCIDMHTKDARAAGETEQRLYCLSVWEETPFYTDRERAALAWTEATTRIADRNVPDELFEQVREFFTEQELVNLTLAVIAINGWNRMSIAFRAVPGEYQPAELSHAR
jgi:AhpD family alkylhydroperoxidase